MKILVIICFVHTAHSIPVNPGHCPHELHLKYILPCGANVHGLEKLELAILFCSVTRARNNLVKFRGVQKRAIHSRGQWVCKFGGIKEIVFITKAFKSHRIFLEHQHGDGPHVSNYDKLSTKIYGYLWELGEVYFKVEFSPFKRRPLSLTFGIRNKNFKNFVEHHISVRIK